jgi:hypothetical protein
LSNNYSSDNSSSSTTFVKTIVAERENGKYIVRNVDPSNQQDVLGCYHVCLATGDFGGDGEPFYRESENDGDPYALGRVYVGPYIRFESDFGIALENTLNNNNNKICGYSFGCLDTRPFFEEKFEKNWRPHLVKAFPAEEGKKSSSNNNSPSRTQQMYSVYRDFKFMEQLNACKIDLEKYPSHLHIDLLEEVRGIGIGRTMLEEVMRRLKEKGSRGVHLCMAASNDKAHGFYLKLGFEDLAKSADGNDLFMGKRFVM